MIIESPRMITELTQMPVGLSATLRETRRMCVERLTIIFEWESGRCAGAGGWRAR
jgi:hypothetical protein